MLFCTTEYSKYSGEHITDCFDGSWVIDPTTTVVVNARTFVANRKTLKMKDSPVVELACARELPGYGLGLEGVPVNAMMRRVHHPYHSSAHEPPKPCDTFRRTSHGLQCCTQAAAVAYKALQYNHLSV